MAFALSLAAISFPNGALAADPVLAESLFRQGRDLMDKGDYAAACPRLSESFAQEPATGTLLALALCHEQSGKTASAWAAFAGVVARAKSEGRADREEAAREHLRALDPKLSRLTIEVDPATASLPGLLVKRDGVAVGPGAWGAPSPLDPGQHVVEVTAPGKTSWRGTVSIGPTADSQVLRVPSLVDEPGSAGAGVPEPDAASSLAEPAEPSDNGAPSKTSTLRTMGLVIGGAGILGLGVSGFFALRTTSLNSESKSGGQCDADNQCDSAGLQKRNDAIRASNVATISLVAGGVLTAAGVTLFIVGGPKNARTDASHVEVTPTVGPGLAAMVLAGRF